MMTARRNVDWRDAAARLAALIPRERLEPTVLAWMERCGVRTRWAVAFSGGADSLALLLLLWAHWPGRRAALRALHFDHRLRGAESRADASFCRQVCAALGIEFATEAWRRPRGAGLPSEAEAREARLAFFAREARVVWLGHQQDDVAETILMRLARGSGTGGLAAPRPVQHLPGKRVHLRPLLSLKKAELVVALREAGVVWREDATNAAGHYFRNRVRRDVLPAWSEAARRDVLGGAALSRRLLEEDDAALEAWLDELQPLDRRGRLDLRVLDGKPRAILRRALHRWALAQTRVGDLSRQAFEALLSDLVQRRPTRHSVGREGFAVTDGELLWFDPGTKRRLKFQRRIN